jgi:hypothetical protein
MIELTNFDELEKEQEQKQETAVQVANTTEKSIADVTLKDVHFKLNTDKTYEEQAEDVVGAMATAKAVEDKGTVDALASAKQSELIDKQYTKVKQAKKQSIEAETEIQKAEWDTYKVLFDTFNINSHLPKWLQKIVVSILTPFYLVFVLAIKVPCGFVRMLIDGIDGIICRYERADERTRPRIKVTVWIIFALVVASAVVLGTLSGLKII